MTKLKEKLEDIKFSFDEKHWKALEKRLDDQRRNRILFCFVLLGGLALLGFATGMYLSSSKTMQNVSHQTSLKPRILHHDSTLIKADPYTEEAGKGMSEAGNTPYNPAVLHKSYTRKSMPQDAQENSTGTQPLSSAVAAAEGITYLSPDTMLYAPVALYPIGLSKIRHHVIFSDTLLKRPPVKRRSRYQQELVAGSSFIIKPKAPNLESFHARSYHLLYRCYLNQHVFAGLGLAMESYRYSVPDYRIIYHDAVVKDQFMAYHGASLEYTQRACAVSAGYRFNLTPRIHAVLEGGLQYMRLVSSKQELDVSYTVEYKYGDTMSRKQDIWNVKNDRGVQKALGLNPLPGHQITYFGKAGVGADIWKTRLGARAVIAYSHLPVLAFVSRSKNHLWMPGVSLYFRF